MAATKKKTDNHYTGDKVQLRIDHSPWPEGRALRVLDAFGGHGIIWRAIERKTGRPVSRTAIDSRQDLLSFHAHGDNAKVMKGMDLSQFDVIDLDAYGIPHEQIEIVIEQGYRGQVFVTCIQAGTLGGGGGVPKGILMDLGFPETICKKAASLPSRRGWDLFLQYLARHGIRTVTHRSKARKHYLTFSGAERPAAGSDSRPGGSVANPS